MTVMSGQISAVMPGGSNPADAPRPIHAVPCQSRPIGPAIAGSDPSPGSTPATSDDQPGFPEEAVRHGGPPSRSLSGAALAAALQALDADALPRHELMDVIEAWRRLASWVKSRELELVNLLADRYAADERYGAAWREWLEAELSLGLTLTEWSASALVETAATLRDRLPGILRCLAEGTLDEPRMRVIVEGVKGLSDAACHRVEKAILQQAGSLTTAKLRRLVAATVDKVAADEAAARRRASERSRRVEFRNDGQGTAEIFGIGLPAGPATAAYNRVDAIARAAKHAGDSRTMDQLRCDVFLALQLGRLHPGSSTVADSVVHSDARHEHDPLVWIGEPEADGIPAQAPPAEDADVPAPDETDVLDQHDQPGGHVRVVEEPATDGYRATPSAGQEAVPTAEGLLETATRYLGVPHLVVGLDTLLGLAETPGELGRYGSLVSDIARQIADGGIRTGVKVCWTVTDQGGEAVHHGETRYRPGVTLRELINARDRSCRFPHCRRPASRCDLDHTLAHDQGGPTCPCNLAPLCRRHHRLKQAEGWTLTQSEPGILAWSTPSGRVHMVHPDPYDTG
ncbi:DUF222 domain-containing protein [Sphaerisporangium sp. NPDC088356]|uniref:HNH endonuclease signature motif containing protein n=1 Tax=Sphaerisporangium sp. NPDC088356 TaxID=3154871 RepID=UPI00343D5EBD